MSNNDVDYNGKIEMSYYAFEKMQSKDERNDFFRNLIIILETIVLLVCLFLWHLDNKHWQELWSQYDYVDEYEIEAQQDGEGINIVGGGDISYGTDSNYSQETIENTP